MKLLKPLPKRTYNIYGSSTFIPKANQDIENLNYLITEFNDAPLTDKAEILLEIYNYQEHINNKYPLRIIAETPEFRQIFHIDLFNELKAEFEELGCPSLYKTKINDFDLANNNADYDQELQINFAALLDYNNEEVFEPFFADDNSNHFETINEFIWNIATEDNHTQLYNDLNRLKGMVRIAITEQHSEGEEKRKLRKLVAGINSKLTSLRELEPTLGMDKIVAQSNFPEFLANMRPDKVSQLIKILHAGDAFEKEQLAGLYAPSENGFEEYHHFLANYSICFLGGVNSKNFKITNNLNGAEFVLKIDLHKNPKSIDTQLAQNTLSEVVTPVYSTRFATYTAQFGKEKTRALLLTEYCKNGNVESYGLKQTTNRDKLKTALSIFTQMAKILETLRIENTAFPDMKNENWLIDEHGKVRLADTKAILPTYEGIFDRANPDFKWFSVINSLYMNPPEFNIATDSFNGEQAHSYMLGKNLYHYLTGCSIEYLYLNHKGSNYNFSAPVFKTKQGEQLETLIKNLIRSNPQNRMSIADAIDELIAIELSPLKAACENLIANIYNSKVGKNDILLQNLRDQYYDIFEDCEDKNELIELKAELENMLNSVNSPEMQEIKAVVAKFRLGANEFFSIGKNTKANLINEFFSIGKNTKANLIEDELRKIPPLERKNVFTNELVGVKVREALASHRHLGKRGTVYKNNEGRIIESKAANSFFKLAQQFKPSEVKATDEANKMQAISL